MGTRQGNRSDSVSDVDVPDTIDQLDQEMKEDISHNQQHCSDGVNAERSAAGSSREESASAWNFVQMNMSLLPIARPLPVSICNRFHDGVIGRKPRTPNQKLHHRVLHDASNISPRRHDVGLLPRRGSADTASMEIPQRMTDPQRAVSAPMNIPGRNGKRKSEHDDQYLSSSWSMPSMFGLEDDSTRARSHSEDLTTWDPRQANNDLHNDLPTNSLSRSASTSSAFAQRGALFRGKRILEIQDEERRLLPDERVASLPSPSKRSRRL